MQTKENPVFLKDQFLATSLLYCTSISIILDICTNILYFYNAQTSLIAFIKLLILFYLIYKIKSINNKLIIVLLVFILISRWIIIYFQGLELDPITDLIYFGRILFLVVSLFVFYENRFNSLLISSMQNIFKTIIYLTVICQLLGLFWGYEFFKAYGDQRPGYKGLFLGENDTSIFLSISYFYGIYLISSERKYFFFLISLIGLALLAPGSKAALLSLFIIPLIYIYLKNKKSIIINFLFILSALLSLFVYLNYGYDWFFEFIGHTQFLQLRDATSFITSALSTRDFRVYDYFDSVQSVFNVIFGSQIANISDYMIEIDFFDYMMRVGFFGILIMLIIFLKVSKTRLSIKRSLNVKSFLFFLLILSCFSGHVFLSTINALWIAFFVVFYANSPLNKNLF